MIIDEFKNFCRDKGKYNVSSLAELIKLFDEFERTRKARNAQTDTQEETDEKPVDFSDILNNMK